MKRFTLILICLLFTFHFAFSQCPTCPIDTIKGKAVYIYEVQKGEGLFRISQNFGVSQEEIIKLNPVLQNTGLKLGQKIRIPVVERIDSTQYIVHIIQPKETLYGLSKRYGVRISDLQELNPETSVRMPIGGKLLVPKPVVTAQPQPAVEPEPVVEPVAEPVVESVAEPAPIEVTEQNIPPVQNRKLGTHTDIKREPTLRRKVLNENALTATQDTTIAVSDSVLTTATPIRLAFMLPFQTSLTSRRTTKENRFIEFYEGALVAIYEEQEYGQTFEIYTYDTEKSEDKISHLLSIEENPEIQLVDAVIGPTYANQVAACYDFALNNHTYFLFPFADKVSNLQTNPYLLQFNPAKERENTIILDWLKAKEDSVYCVLIDDDSEAQRNWMQWFETSQIAYIRISTSAVLEDSLSYIWQSGKENIVFFPTNRYADAQELINKVVRTKGSYDVALFTPYAWSEELPLKSYYVSVFKKQALIDMHRLHYKTLRDRYFADEIEQQNPRYDLLGYDLTCYLIKLLQTKATTDTFEVSEIKHCGVQSDLQFQAVSPAGGYQNAEVKVLKR